MIARVGHHRAVLVLALATAVCVILLVVLAVVVQPAATPSDSDGGNPAAHTMGGGEGSDFTKSPAIERHAEVVAAYNSE
jgi:hypothetical protein